MWFLIKSILILALLGGGGLVGYAMLADLSPARDTVVVPVQIDVD